MAATVTDLSSWLPGIRKTMGHLRKTPSTFIYSQWSTVVFLHSWHNPKHPYKYSTSIVIFSKYCYILVLLKRGGGCNFKRCVLKRRRRCINMYLSQVCENTIISRFSLLWLIQKWSSVVRDQLQDRQRKIEDRLQTVLIQRHWRVTTWSDGYNYAWLTTNWHKL